MRFAGGESRMSLPAFNKEANWFELVEVNELSIERLHHLGAVERLHGYAISPAGTSFGLRSGKMFEHADGDPSFLETFAGLCGKVRSPAGVIQQFQFDKHPEVMAAKDDWTVRGANISQNLMSHKRLCDVFYHCDDYSMYHSQPALKQLIADAKVVEAKEREGALKDPLADAKRDEASEELACQAVHHQAAFEHFKAS